MISFRVATKYSSFVNYKSDGAKLAPFIRGYLKKEVELTPGKQKQIKSSYKLNKVEKAEKTKKPAPKKIKELEAKNSKYRNREEDPC